MMNSDLYDHVLLHICVSYLKKKEKEKEKKRKERRGT